ncbi:MAG: secretin N-terminal domain-containing protein [Chlamydiales bacterium]
MKKQFLSLFTLLPLALGAQDDGLEKISKPQTISEKKKSFQPSGSEIDQTLLEQLPQVNDYLEKRRFELKQLHDQAYTLYQNDGAREEQYRLLIDKIKKLKEEIAEAQRLWQQEVFSSNQSEAYALWHQPDSTLLQLIIDYGAADFIYLVPPEIGSMHVSLNSNLPIPRESWRECLELILAQYGIGIRELNPYMRELYLLHNDASGIKGIVDCLNDLDLFPPQSQVIYLFSSHATDPRSDLLFLRKFSNPNTTKVEILGGKIYITGTVESIQELLKLQTFISKGNHGEDFQLISLNKIDAKEMKNILDTAFHDGAMAPDGSSLRILPLENASHSLFLTGSKEEVKKAIKLTQDIESQIEDPQEKTVFWYTAKHSDAEELAVVLARVYDLLVENQANKSEKPKKEDKIIVPPSSEEPKTNSHKTADGQNNFVVDPKTGAIIMVVEQEALPKIKELLKKLDVPKKMIQIEVLLFEKKVTHHSKFGLNLLRLGANAANKTSSSIGWQNQSKGILEFLISRGKSSGIPAYDLAYQFLLGQDDIQINASPSITTVNQTPATFSTVDEISIHAGSDDKNKDIYNRAEYGITIQVTPTINMSDEGEESNFISLNTDIMFDTTKNSTNDRPDVTRRKIKNYVRIADGETVILGGLRCKNTHDSKDSIPFLGEIPGIGKLFSTTDMNDTVTDMFIFITPKIISDPLENTKRVQIEELKKRPGDLPEFFYELHHAKEREKKRLFEKSLTALFGREKQAHSSFHPKMEEYEGK